MWDVVGVPLDLKNGNFRQHVIWRGEFEGASQGNYSYSVLIDGAAKKVLDQYFAAERPKGNATNLAGVIVTFLKRRSIYQNPPAVDGQLLTADEVREILGLQEV